MIFLDSEKIEDPVARENLEKISEVINGNPLMKGQFKVFDIDVTDTSSVVKIPHNLKFTPTDVWVSWINPTSTIVVRYDMIDGTHLAFTSSAQCKVRLIAGRMK